MMIYHSNKNKVYSTAHKYCLLCAVFFIALFIGKHSLAQHIINLPPLQDSLSFNQSNAPNRLVRIMDNPIVQSAYVPTVFLIEGLCFTTHNGNFKDMRYKYLKSFAYDYDTYLQFTPLTITYSLKLFGLQSRSKWDELFVSTLLSYSFGWGMTKLIKHNVKSTRPDYSGANSFPSGHTTIAFINAAILSKEYKEQYPWISILGYSCATVTGLSRVANNRHWMSDVLFGASLGCLMTELSYGLTDLWFNKKHSSSFISNTPYDDYEEIKPSFADVYLSYNRLMGTSNKGTLSNNSDYRIHNGVSIAIEGAYFVNNHWGVNLRLKEDSYRFENQDIWWPRDSILCVNTVEIGPIYSMPLSSRVFGGIRTGVGFNHLRNNQLEESIKIKEQNNFLFSSGCFINLWMERHVFVRFFADYYLSRIKVEQDYKAKSSLNFAFAIALHF